MCCEEASVFQSRLCGLGVWPRVHCPVLSIQENWRDPGGPRADTSTDSLTLTHATPRGTSQDLSGVVSCALCSCGSHGLSGPQLPSLSLHCIHLCPFPLCRSGTQRIGHPSMRSRDRTVATAEYPRSLWNSLCPAHYSKFPRGVL